MKGVRILTIVLAVGVLMETIAITYGESGLLMLLG